MLRRKYLIIFFFLWIPQFVFAQSNETDSTLLKKELSQNYWQYMKVLNRKNANLSLGISASIYSFNGSNLIAPTFGQNFSGRVLIFPCILDFGYFYNKTTVKSTIPIYQSKDVFFEYQNRHYSLSICPLPPLSIKSRMNQLSEIIVPYIGLGYHWSEFNMKEKGSQGKISESYLFDNRHSIDMSSIVFKVGCNFFLKKIAIVLDFEQGLNKDNLRNVSAFSIGIFTNFAEKFYFDDKSKIYLPR